MIYNSQIDFPCVLNFLETNKHTLVSKPLYEYQKEQEDSVSMLSVRRAPRRKSHNFFRINKINNLVQKFKQKLTKNSAFSKKSGVILNNAYFKERYLSDTGNLKETNLKVLGSATLYPGCKFLIIWEFLKTLIVGALFFILPLQRSFDMSYFRGINYYAFGYLGIDIIIKLNTAYLHKGNIISSRLQILKTYLQLEMFQDLLIAAALISNDIFIVVVLLIKLYICLNELQNSLNLTSTQREFTNLIKLTLQMISFLHLIACFWYFIGLVTGDSLGKSWIIQQEIQLETPFVQYCYAYYWATISMVTVGYGDITPVNYIEIIYCIIVSLIASGLFAYCINQIGQILTSFNDLKAKLTLQIRKVNTYMAHNDIPVTLQNQIRNYLEYVVTQQQENESEDIHSISGALSQQLREKLMQHVFQNLIKDCKLFTSNFSEQTLQRLALSIQAVQFCPGEKIFDQDKMDDSAVFLVQSGVVQLVDQHQELKVCKKGQCFGESSFFTMRPRKCTAISLNFTKAYKIDRKTFLEIATDEDCQRFHDIGDKITFGLSLPGFECFVCKGSDHSMSSCSYLRYNPDKEAVILRGNFSIPNSRDGQYKRKRQKTNTLKILAKLRNLQAEQQDTERSDDTQSIIKEVGYILPGLQSALELKHEEDISNRPSDLQISKQIIMTGHSKSQQQFIESLNVDKQKTFLNYHPNFNLASVLQHYNRIRHLLHNLQPSNGYQLVKQKVIRHERKLKRKQCISMQQF